MDKKLGCPSTSELAELLQGKMVDPDLSNFSLHLEECSACQEKARTLAPNDTLVESLRGEPLEADEIARDVPRLVIERLKQIPRGDSSFGGEVLEQALELGIHSDKQGFEFLAPARAADEIGWLGGYRILEVLGRGGMGIVFLAEDPKLGRHVALKVMLPRIAADPTAKDRFLREARAAARLKSDHIVTIYQVDETNGVPHLAMELLEGQPLDDVLRFEQPLSVAQILHIGRDIATGLAAAHEKGQIHRDIKPANLWLEGKLSTRFRVKILDFGLARAALDDSHITHSGAIVGTPAFMAPEQARGDKVVDARADLFSLGCVLYRLCTGEVPFKAESTLGTLMAVAMQDPVAPEMLNQSVPSELSRLIMQLLEKNPDRRPKSARDVIARIVEIERSLPTSNDVSATSSSATCEISADATIPAYPALAASRGLRNPLPLILALVGVSSVFLTVIAGTIFYWQMPHGGLVRIECNDPSIKVAFNNGELKVTGAYKEPITIKPGKVDLRIVKKGAKGDDFEFQTDKLIVNKGDKIVLRIEVVDGKVQIVQSGRGVLDSKLLPVSPETIAVSDPDRAAAKWILAIGGKVQLNGADPWIEDTTGLPEEKFSVTEINLVANPYVTDSGLAHLKDLSKLTMLNLDSSNVSDAGLEHFRNLKALTVLNMYGANVSDEGVVHLQDLQELRRLGLGGGTKVTDAGLVRLKTLRKLTNLFLDGTRVTDAGLHHLKDLKHLTELDLGATAVTDAGLVHLKDIKKLNSLSLHHTQATDATLKLLKSVPAMTILNLDGTKVTDRGLENLHALKSLQILYIRNTRVTREALKHFHAAVPSCKIEHDGEPL